MLTVEINSVFSLGMQVPFMEEIGNDIFGLIAAAVVVGERDERGCKR